jgi:hypothetical protein
MKCQTIFLPMSLSLLLALLLLLGLYVWFSRRRGQGRQRGRAWVQPGGPVAGHTRRELLRLVGGNREVAERLVEQVQVRYPNRNLQWCWEKAIYDIQRDRRS